TAHFPKHVDVDRASPTGDVVGALHLLDRTVDRISDQLLVPLEPRQLVVDLRDDLAFGIVTVGVDRANRADATCGRPRSRTHVIGRGYPLTAFDQRPHFASAVKDGFQPLEFHFHILLALYSGAVPVLLPCWRQGTI